MATKVEVDPTPDAFTAFGNQVADELRLLQDTAILNRLKWNIMNMVYDAQDGERNRSSSSSAHIPPHCYTFATGTVLPTTYATSKIFANIATL